MRLTSFKIEGFKNFRAPVELNDLESLNVFHGDNNVGKSNALEAILVFFRALGVATMNWPIPDQGLPIRPNQIASETYAPESWFNILEPLTPIRMTAAFAFDASALPTGEKLPDRDLSLSVTLTNRGAVGGLQLKLTTPPLSRTERVPPTVVGFPSMQPQTRRVTSPWGAVLLPTIQWMVGERAEGHISSVARIHTDRWLEGNLVSTKRDDVLGGPLSDAMVRALYDSRDTPNRQRARIWQRFESACARFEDLLEGGKPLVVNPSHEAGGKGKPFLLIVRPDDTRLAADQLGSGVQQLLGLLGHMLTCNARIVLVEEPELNLRHNLQLRLAQILREVVGKDGAPDQIILTSHSAAFEAGDQFFGFERSSGGVKVSRQDRTNLRKFVGFPETTLALPGDDASLAWLTGEGVVQLPEFAVGALHAEQGAAVIFRRERDERIEILRADDPAVWDDTGRS
jgi:hypothetical protein